jgi:hypothetical protein
MSEGGNGGAAPPPIGFDSRRRIDAPCRYDKQMPLTGDAKREYQRQWIAARRREWFEGKACAKCGSTDRLEAHHRNPAEKLCNPRNLWGMSAHSPFRVAELAKLDPLCRACHIDLSRAPVRHATWSAYNRKGCRCDECRAWNASRTRVHRERVKVRA